MNYNINLNVISDKLSQLNTTLDFDNQLLVWWLDINATGKTLYPFVWDMNGDLLFGVKELYAELKLKELEEKNDDKKENYLEQT